jgi:hypothetical protein
MMLTLLAGLQSLRAVFGHATPSQATRFLSQTGEAHALPMAVDH